MVFRAASAEELAERGDFVNLPDDEYLATVSAMEFDSAEGKPATLYGPAQDQYKVTLDIKSFADGSPLEDTDGNPVESFQIRTWINHNKIGMVPQPSKARKFFAACLGQPIANAIEIANFPDDLIGKQLYVSTINNKSAKGGTFTNAQDFRPLRINRAGRNRSQEVTVNAQSEADETSDEIQF